MSIVSEVTEQTVQQVIGVLQRIAESPVDLVNDGDACMRVRCEVLSELQRLLDCITWSQTTEHGMSATRVHEVDSEHITEDFLNCAMERNDGCAHWWTVCGRTLVSVEVGEDGFVAEVKSERATSPAVCEVPLHSRSQLLCLLRGLGVE